MRLSVSNIGWDVEYDQHMLEYMQENGITGLEIAPTRIVENEPYENQHIAKTFAEEIQKEYGLEICSMQSIWYGKTERIFGSREEFNFLVEYTKKAIDFANAMGCGNIVFGCPKNRALKKGSNENTAVEFFRVLGDYAKAYGIYISVEPNPDIYGTNFLNTTREAVDFIKRVGHSNITINLDLGTMIYNEESLEIVEDSIKFINHIHISEPYLNSIVPRSLHKNVMEILIAKGYTKFVSIEMKKNNDLAAVKSAIRYVKEVFA